MRDAYIVVKSDDLESLVLEVNRLKIDGYDPQGGLCITSSLHFGNVYFQAMVLRPEL